MTGLGLASGASASIADSLQDDAAPGFDGITCPGGLVGAVCSFVVLVCDGLFGTCPLD